MNRNEKIQISETKRGIFINELLQIKQDEAFLTLKINRAILTGEMKGTTIKN